MYSSARLTLKYLNYYFTAANGKGHGTHSPYVFHFITNVLNDKKNYPEYVQVEQGRMELLKNRDLLTIEDFGAGSAVAKSNTRSISSIAKNAAKPKKYSQLFFRMIREYQPATILELGTSLGITTKYLALANPGAKVVTLEGATAIAAVARTQFRQQSLQNISLIEGNIDDTLTIAITELKKIDFAFIDGNHRKEPTVRYFNQLLKAVDNDSILVFDDIHWSAEMEDAWAEIKNHPEVTCTIDLFFIGIVIFKKDFLSKQHFCIRY